MLGRASRYRDPQPGSDEHRASAPRPAHARGCRQSEGREATGWPAWGQGERIKWQSAPYWHSVRFSTSDWRISLADWQVSTPDATARETAPSVPYMSSSWCWAGQRSPQIYSQAKRREPSGSSPALEMPETVTLLVSEESVATLLAQGSVVSLFWSPGSSWATRFSGVAILPKASTQRNGASGNPPT